MSRVKDQTPVTSKVKNGSQEPDNDVSAHEYAFFFNPSLCRPAENNVSAQAKSPAASHNLSVQSSQLLVSAYYLVEHRLNNLGTYLVLIACYSSKRYSSPVKMHIKVGD